MRQAGILAAAMNYALENNVQRLQIDHDNARRLADGLCAINGIRIVGNDTNMVFLELPSQQIGEQLARNLAEQGVKVIGGKTMRLVTHLDVTAADIDRVLGLVRMYLA